MVLDSWRLLVIVPLEQSEMVASEGFAKGNVMEIVQRVKCSAFPKETPVKVCCISGVSWALFPIIVWQTVFVLGRQMLQGENCWRGRAAGQELLWVVLQFQLRE